MDYFKLVIFLLLSGGLLIAQTTNTNDSIYVTLNGDTATIWHTQTHRNCGSNFLLFVQITDSLLTVWEVDVGDPAFCFCYFDLSVSYGPLSPGYYIVEVYSTDLSGSYWGSTSFFIEGNINNEVPDIVTYAQSDCYALSTDSYSHLPENVMLRQNHPNPFNLGTTISYELPIDTRVHLAVYDLLGREVAVLVDGIQPSDQHETIWDAQNVAGGIYFYRLTTPNSRITKKLVVLK